MNFSDTLELKMKSRICVFIKREGAIDVFLNLSWVFLSILYKNIHINV